MELRIQDLIGARCITKDDGQRIYDAIQVALKGGEPVTLDFAGVTQFASPFFNFAIGQLLKDVPIGDLKSLLSIKNLVPDGRLVVDRVIENASRYHSDLNYQKIVDSILNQQAEEAG
jgi:hypothetical protein